MDTSGPHLFRVLLEVSGLDDAVRFYSTLLGTGGRGVGGSRHYFDCGILFGLVDVAVGGERPRPVPQNVYFATAELDAIYERARALGCLSGEDVHGAAGGVVAVRPWGERSFYGADPFGNKLCFVDETTLFTGQ